MRRMISLELWLGKRVIWGLMFSWWHPIRILVSSCAKTSKFINPAEWVTATRFWAWQKFWSVGKFKTLCRLSIFWVCGVMHRTISLGYPVWGRKRPRNWFKNLAVWRRFWRTPTSWKANCKRICDCMWSKQKSVNGWQQSIRKYQLNWILKGWNWSLWMSRSWGKSLKNWNLERWCEEYSVSRVRMPILDQLLPTRALKVHRRPIWARIYLVIQCVPRLRRKSNRQIRIKHRYLELKLPRHRMKFRTTMRS